MEYLFNEYQTPVDDEFLSDMPNEVQEQFFDFINNVEFIRNLVSKDRRRACDCERDESGKIIVDLANPHILEDMDYFRPSALHYMKHKCFTHLRPNGNQNSEFFKWFKEEYRRCYEGYVRESDGEWVTGYMYWFLNYNPIMLTKIVDNNSKRGARVFEHPEVWEGIYLRFHYMEQARNGGKYDWDGGKNCAELASRGKGKSFSLASILSHDFIIGETAQVQEKVNAVVIAYQKEYLIKDGVLNKFQTAIDFLADTTQFPSMRLKDSINEMAWQLGYKSKDGTINKGLQNTVYGVTVKENTGKARGKRSTHVLIEEFNS